MIDCPNGDVRDMLPDYLHDRLESSARASVEQHLAGCAACRDELALLRDLRGTLHRAPRIDVAAVAAAIPPYRAPVRKASSMGSWRAAAAIAAIAVGGTSIALLGRERQPARVAEIPVAAPTTPAPEVGASTPAVVVPQPGVERVPSVPQVAAPRATPAPAPKGEELAMGGGAIADLSDGELSDLLGDLESLDALPSTDVESAQSLLPARHGGRHE